jgi:hypothetical protein
MYCTYVNCWLGLPSIIAVTISIYVIWLYGYLCGLQVVTVHPYHGASDGLGRIYGQRQVLVPLNNNICFKSHVFTQLLSTFECTSFR